MQEKEIINDNDRAPPAEGRHGMVGSVSLDRLIAYYERELILMHRLLKAEQREVERLWRKLEGR